MYIFHRFPSRAQAVDFGATVKFGLRRWAEVYDTQQQSDAVDPFPYQLAPPIVLVERTDDDSIEARLIEIAERSGGSYAGT